MKTLFQLKALSLFVCACLVSSVAFAQMGKGPASPRDSVSGTIKGGLGSK
ncbi:MAG TPA: hypothetical protein VIJ27_01920 [Mucilaginibacter sp.]